MLAWLRNGWMRWRGDRKAASPLYDAVVARGREPHWYVDGAVPDTIDGRFDMIAAVLAMVLLRLEADPDPTGDGAETAARLTERFVDDMDGQLREIGIGDIVVGKHIGRMMSMLGGRLGAYRDGLVAGDPAPALARNLYRGEPPAAGALAYVACALEEWSRGLAARPLASVIAGELP